MKMPSYWTEKEDHIEFDLSFLDSQKVSDEEIFAFSDVEREQYIQDRRHYHEWHRRQETLLYKQGLMGIALILMNLIVPSGAIFVLAPLGVGLIASAICGKVMIG